MKRKIFLKSLLGLAIAPMALAKIIPKNKEITFKGMRNPNVQIDMEKVKYGPLTEEEFWYGDQWPKSVLRRVKERQDKINKLHFNIIQGIRT